MSESSSVPSVELGVHDALETRMLARALAALDRAGIPAILFKGAALGRTTYAASWQRPRADADLLVPAHLWQQADEALSAAVGDRLQPVIDPRVMGQWQYRDRETGLLLDLHLRLFEPAPFADLLSFDELRASSVDVPGLGAARAPGPVHALWIALIHPVAHHNADVDPVWSEDLRRISARCDDTLWDAFTTLAHRTATCTICVTGLTQAGVALSSRVRADLEARDEPTAALLSTRGHSAIARHVMFLRALPSWSERLRAMTERLFPPADYMRARYGGSTLAGLWLRYVQRIVSGLAGPWRAAAPRARDRFNPPAAPPPD